jgi:hypothetical protein
MASLATVLQRCGDAHRRNVANGSAYLLGPLQEEGKLLDKRSAPGQL